jgi:hypothetical protein
MNTDTMDSDVICGEIEKTTRHAQETLRALTDPTRYRLRHARGRTGATLVACGALAMASAMTVHFTRRSRAKRWTQSRQVHQFRPIGPKALIAPVAASAIAWLWSRRARGTGVAWE